MRWYLDELEDGKFDKAEGLKFLSTTYAKVAAQFLLEINEMLGNPVLAGRLRPLWRQWFDHLMYAILHRTIILILTKTRSKLDIQGRHREHPSQASGPSGKVLRSFYLSYF